MQKSDALRVDIVKHQQKEARLTSFIADQIGVCVESGCAISVLARSIESPVVRALSSLHAAGRLANIAIKVILLEAGTTVGRAAHGAATGALGGSEFRLIADKRILDAHEQMIMAPTVCWIGDCMRRDPSTRDAFETMTTTHRIATSHAQASFARLWAIAAPLSVPVAEVPADVEPPIDAPEALPPQAGEISDPTVRVLSRH
jgi:hypothetical protein